MDEATEFPAWYYGPDGQSQIFQSADDVPNGWEDHPSKVGASKRGKKAATEPTDNDDEKAKELVDGNDQAQLIEKLKELQKKDSSIEFSESWPKLKLAQTIVAAEKGK